MSEKAVKRILQNSEAFSSLSQEEMDEVLRGAEPFRAAPGETLFEIGDVSEHIYFVEKGLIRVNIYLPGKERFILSEVGPGEMLGETALADVNVRSASAVAVEATEGYALSKHYLNAMRAGFRPLAYKTLRQISKLICSRIRAANNSILSSMNSEKEREDHIFVGKKVDQKIRIDKKKQRPSTDCDIENLKRFPIFKKFNKDELSQLLQHMVLLEAPKKTTVFCEGDVPDACYIVVQGAAEISVHRGDNKEKLGLLGPGKMFGHLALIDQELRTTACATRENSLLLMMEEERFNSLFEEKSIVAYKFFDIAFELLLDALHNADKRRSWLTARRLS